MPPLVSSQNETWGTGTEIPYWWRVATKLCIVLLIGWSKFPSWTGPIRRITQIWVVTCIVISIEFHEGCRGRVLERTCLPLASHAGVFRGARVSSLPTNTCSTENKIPFPLFYLCGMWPINKCEKKCWQVKQDSYALGSVKTWCQSYLFPFFLSFTNVMQCT